jgi:hypothetical protein
MFFFLAAGCAGLDFFFVARETSIPIGCYVEVGF